MHDLRNDPATHAVLTAEQLRIEPMPNLRSPDAEARDLRTAGDKLAELQRQVSALQETARLHDATLLAIARRFDELAARPLAMAEDAWGVG